jgi:hypothetical protein
LRALQIDTECRRRGEDVSRTVLQESLQIPQAEAQHIIWCLDNKDIIRCNPDVFNADGERCIVCADIHIPYQDNLAVSAMIEYMLEYKPTTIIIDGDILDFYQISSFVKNPANKGTSEEIRETKKFLTELRQLFPDARIIIKEGNHEQRLEKYIFQNAKAIADLIDDLIPMKLGLSELKIEYKIDPFSFGKLWILHGHEKPGGAYNPEYITNVIWQYVHDHFAVGHFHRGQEKIFKNIKGDTFYACSVPYLAGKMDYAVLNKWSQGFLRVDFSTSGKFKAQLLKIIDGEIF